MFCRRDRERPIRRCMVMLSHARGKGKERSEGGGLGQHLQVRCSRTGVDKDG